MTRLDDNQLALISRVETGDRAFAALVCLCSLPSWHLETAARLLAWIAPFKQAILDQHAMEAEDGETLAAYLIREDSHTEAGFIFGLALSAKATLASLLHASRDDGSALLLSEVGIAALESLGHRVELLAT